MTYDLYLPEMPYKTRLLFFGTSKKINLEPIVSTLPPSTTQKPFHSPYHPCMVYFIFAYIYYRNQPNVGKDTSPMDGMGSFLSDLRPCAMSHGAPVGQKIFTILSFIFEKLFIDSWSKADLDSGLPVDPLTLKKLLYRFSSVLFLAVQLHSPKRDVI